MLEAVYMCQWCGTVVTISVDPAAGRNQEWVEDCERCCRPNILVATIDLQAPQDEAVYIEARREND